NAGAFAPPPVGNIGLGEGWYPFCGPGINRHRSLSLSKTFRFNLQRRRGDFHVENFPPAK
ncbi:MAG: hypothetical protein ACRD5Z_20445, partial [Bryobacteraceae bacterium]